MLRPRRLLPSRTREAVTRLILPLGLILLKDFHSKGYDVKAAGVGDGSSVSSLR